MAIVKNFWLKNQQKKLAGMVLYKAMGQTRSRELASEVSNPRTIDQMSQRVRWSNLVNFYRANKSWMKFAYETKPKNRTDYNQFMSLNAGTSRIYLPKSLANQGGCVVDSYVMTQGSLGSIETMPSDGNWVTNIYLPDSYEFDEVSTVAEVSQAILSSNPAMREGDQLSFIRLTQQTNSNTGVPYVVIRKYEVILNSSDLRFFKDFMPLDYIGAATESDINCIYVKNSGNAGGFLLILSRTTGGKTYVSTQSVVVANNEATIAAYSSQNALQTAIDSYGESAEPFLTSTTANIDNQAPVAISIVSVDGDLGSAVPGELFGPKTIVGGEELHVHMSQAIESVGQSARVVISNGQSSQNVNISNASEEDDYVLIGWPNNAPTGDGWYILDIYCEVNGVSCRAPFAHVNINPGGGLE